MSRPVAVSLASVVLLVALGLALRPSRPGPRPPAPAPPPAPPDDAAFRDPGEELIYALEDMLDLQRIALTQFAPEQAAEFFDERFAGDAWFDDAPWTTDFEKPHVRTSRRGAPAPLARDGVAGRLRAFLDGFDRVDAVTYKFDGAAPQGSDGATGVLKVTFAARRDGLPTEIFERYDATFRRDPAGWRIRGLARQSGARKEGRRPVFVDATAALGLAVEPALDCHACLYLQPFINCGGLAAGDYDGDGDLDLFATRIGPSLLMRNDGGRFTDVTRAAGLDRKLAGSGAIWLDADNDGRLDLLVTAICRPADPCEPCAVTLFRNRGDGTFEDVTKRAIGAFRGSAHSACAADIDGDGDLDVFVARYGEPKSLDTLSVRVMTRSYVAARDGQPDLLFVNRGDGTFEERAAAAGVADPGWGFACLFTDSDGDGRPDLYVVNDFGPHLFYRNRGDGTFEDRSKDAGGDVGFGMGVCGVDYDRDGDVDLYVSNMYSTAGNRVVGRDATLDAGLRKTLLKLAQGNSLLRNDGGRMTETAVAAGCANAGWAWGSAALDYDEDGWPDLYVANGLVSARSRKDL